MLNRLNIVQLMCTTADTNFRLHFHQNGFFKDDNILIKKLRQLMGYSATCFLR